MKSFKLSLIALALVAATSSQASDRSLGDIYRECGIGAMLFPNDSMLAVISNVTWDLGTTATSSNISSEGMCKGKSAKVAAFVSSSYDKLESEVVAGKGKYVETLAKISGKSIDSIRDSFKKVVTSKEFASMKKEQKAQKLFEIAAI